MSERGIMSQTEAERDRDGAAESDHKKRWPRGLIVDSSVMFTGEWGYTWGQPSTRLATSHTKTITQPVCLSIYAPVGMINWLRTVNAAVAFLACDSIDMSECVIRETASVRSEFVEFSWESQGWLDMTTCGLIFETLHTCWCSGLRWLSNIPLSSVAGVLKLKRKKGVEGRKKFSWKFKVEEEESSLLNPFLFLFSWSAQTLHRGSFYLR